MNEFIGKKYGKWTIVSTFRKKFRNYFSCICECLRKSEIPAYKLLNGAVKSCVSCAAKKHGYYKSPTWNSWCGAKNRCNNPNNKDYSFYGGRGIKFSESWNKFESFLADMGEKPKGLTLDRINNNGNYEPGNCRWASYSEQNSNQRKRTNSSGRLPLYSHN